MLLAVQSISGAGSSKNEEVLKNTQMECLGTQFSVGLGSANGWTQRPFPSILILSFPFDYSATGRPQ